MKTKKDLIHNWFDKAEKDFLTAQHELTFEDAVKESICFHCQQAVEKYLKAYLIFLEINFPKTHEIGELIGLIENVDNNISQLKNEADKLTDYAVEIRYPDDWFEPNQNDVTEAINITQQIREYIKEKIIF